MGTRRAIIGVALSATVASAIAWNYWPARDAKKSASETNIPERPGQIQHPARRVAVAAPKGSGRIELGAQPREVAPGVSAYFDSESARILRIKTGEVVVQIEDETSLTALTTAAKSHGATVTSGRRKGIYRVQGVAQDFNEVLRELGSIDGVRYAEPNFVGKASDIGAPNVVIPEQESLVKTLGLEEAWATTRGGGIIVAVVDSGVDLNHPNLVAGLVPGYDYVNGDDEPADDNGHGTACAGIVAARDSANAQISGVAPASRIMPIKVLDDHANGSYFDVADGVDWAVDHGAKVVLLALGGYARSRYLAEAVARANKRDVIVVASAGNGGNSTPMYPAALDGVLSVGALDSQNTVADYSSTGKTVDLFAPGDGVWTTHFGQRNGGFSGSSAAAAVAAGVAALAAANQPGHHGHAVSNQLIERSEFLRYADSGGAHSARRISAGMAFGPGGRDLAVVGLETAVPSVVEGTPVNVRVFVQNRGRDTQDGVVSVGLASGSKQEIAVERLRAGEVKVLETTITGLAVDMHELVAESAADSNTSNNAARTQVFVRPSDNPTFDIGLSEVKLSEVDFVAGGPKPSINVTVKNWGQKPISGAPIVCAITPIFRNGVNVWEPTFGGQQKLGSTSVDLAVGQEKAVSIEWPNSIALDGTLSVNCSALVNDHRVSNNSRVVRFGVTSPGEVAGLHMGVTHRHIMAQALEYLKLEHGALLYGAARDLAVDGGLGMLATMQQGSSDEDNTRDIDYAYDEWPNRIYWDKDKTFGVGLGYEQSLDHFWDPDADPTGIKVVDYQDDIAGYDPGAAHGANEKARIHMRNVEWFYAAWQNGGRWDMSLLDKTYHTLGRVGHLLADMTVPAHALTDIHIPGDYYDNTWAASNYDHFIVDASWLGNSPNISGYGLGIPQHYWMISNCNTPSALNELMFGNAQAAQLYCSNDLSGNDSIPTLLYFPSVATIFGNQTKCSMQAFYGAGATGTIMDAVFGTSGDPNSTVNIIALMFRTWAPIIGSNLMPLAIRSTASLLRLFEAHIMSQGDADLDGILDAVDLCPNVFDTRNVAICSTGKSVAVWMTTTGLPLL